MDKKCNVNIFTNQLARLLLIQSGLLRDDEELIQDTPKVPASVGDILRSKNYWLKNENGRLKRNKTS
jgi:hypothetical protein